MKSHFALVLSVVALTAACSSKGKLKEPSDLQTIREPTLRADDFWSARAGGGTGGLHLLVRDDAVFSASADGDVFAFDLISGKRLWAHDTNARLAGGPGAGGSLVLVGTLDAEVIALDRLSGQERWRAKMPSEVLTAPVATDDTVLVRTGDGRVFGLNAADGVRLWNFDRGVPPLTLRGMSQPLLVGDRVIAGLDNGRVAALDVRSGRLLWEQVVSAPTGRSELERLADVDAELLADGEMIYAASYGGDLVALSRDTGTILWRTALRSYTGMAGFGTTLAVSDEDGVVWMLDATTGAVQWKQEALKYRQLSAPAAQPGALVVGDFEGYLHWLAPQDGRLLARDRAVRDPIRAPLIARDRIVFVLSSEGKIVAVETRPNS